MVLSTLCPTGTPVATLVIKPSRRLPDDQRHSLVSQLESEVNEGIRTFEETVLSLVTQQRIKQLSVSIVDPVVHETSNNIDVLKKIFPRLNEADVLAVADTTL